MKVTKWQSFIAGVVVALVILITVPHLAGVVVGLLGVASAIYLVKKTGRKIKRKEKER